jgi:hypothetical protein
VDTVYLLLYLGSIVLFLCLWHVRVVHALAPRTVASFAGLAALSFVYGRAFLIATALERAAATSLTLQFLSGYLLLNLLLLVLAFASPLSIGGNILVACLIGIVLFVAPRRRNDAQGEAKSHAPALIGLLLSGVASTLWCNDALTPMVREGDVTIFQLWGDSFVHARHISVFAQAHGLASMSDIRMAGAPPFLYHYASYALPAAVNAMTAIGAYETFASFLLPVGVLLTGLAAYAFAASLWGRWPGLGACAALLLLPDGYQQGFGNKYLSYNFMQQVNVGSLYGVACVAVAWIFVLDGCRSRRWSSIIVGWALALVTLPYKAHVFVANAFLIMIYPCLFFGGMRVRSRLALAAGLIACFVAVVVASQGFDRIPTLRLDGSGARTYLSYLLVNYDAGWARSLAVAGLGEPPWSAARVAVAGSLIILVSTLGYWCAALAPAVWMSRTLHPAAGLFPLLIVVNYLVMALGLAMDQNEIGAPDELINRPLVWAHFAVAAWTGGALYYQCFGNNPPRSTAGKALAASVAIAALAVAATFGANLQTFPHWVGFRTFTEGGAVPTCLVDAAHYIRDHGAVTDVVQDSENDSRVWLTGLSERADFAMLAPLHPPAGLLDRLEQLAELKRMTNAQDIRRFAQDNHIAWYLLRPNSEVAWPQTFRDTSVFTCGGYRVFHFGP